VVSGYHDFSWVRIPIRWNKNENTNARWMFSCELHDEVSEASEAINKNMLDYVCNVLSSSITILKVVLCQKKKEDSGVSTVLIKRETKSPLDSSQTIRDRNGKIGKSRDRKVKPITAFIAVLLSNQIRYRNHTKIINMTFFFRNFSARRRHRQC
jgi:hypothetical protein